MSRLDYHVTKVQGKLLLSNVLQALAWALLVYGGVVWLVILAGKLVQLRLPHEWVWFWSGLGVTVALALGYSVWHRPTRQRAAVAIDEKLGLKEKFSTALYVRPSTDPFAAAAVRDAEVTAERVHLQDKFPVRLPVAGLFTAGVAFVAFLTAWLLQPMDLLGREQARTKALTEQAQQAEVKTEIKKALAKIESAPPEVLKDENIQMATKDLRQMLARPTNDPVAAAKKAQDALEDVEAQTQKIKELQNVAQAFNEMRDFKKLSEKPIDESGPVGKAHTQLAKGNFSEAVETLSKTVKDFDKMEKKDQQKAAEQMKNMANQLKAMANDPQQQQEMQKKLQDMGASKNQSQQMTKAMQQAANGDKQAQQQLQQMANQMMQQMNNGQGPSQQQIQQAKQMMQQMQAQANGQAQAQQLAQNAQQLAQAMQQAAQAGQQQQQGQQPGQKQGQQANAGQPGGKQPQQQPGGQQPNPQQQPGGQQQQANQGQQQAQQQMQQQVAQMQAQAQAAAAAAAAAQQGGQQGPDGQQPGGGQPGGQQGGDQPGQMAGGGEDAFKQGDPAGKKGDGAGGVGQGAGDRPRAEAAPHDFKPELSRSDTIEKGRILASTYVKASALKGESKAKFQEAVESLEAEATDEVDQTRVSRAAREAVRQYHKAMSDDAPAAK